MIYIWRDLKLNEAIYTYTIYLIVYKFYGKLASKKPSGPLSAAPPYNYRDGPALTGPRHPRLP
jgi:hypothetical protein